MAEAAKPTKAQADAKKYLLTCTNAVAAYDREFEPWTKRVKKILDKYRDERNLSGGNKNARFNILWSNVQTLVPATFSRIPQPDVSRRFRDNDPVGRVASLILERALDFEIQHYPDYRDSLRQSLYDRFLGGRGTIWARYEPHITAAVKKLPEDGVELTEDIDEGEDADEELEYECAPLDYVHWKDFGHSVARTWEEVPKVWRRVYMLMPAKTERFGEKVAKQIPKDSRPDKEKAAASGQNDDEGSWIYELWDKDKRQAIWFHKSMPDALDTKDDPLGLEGFFPCPKPLFATLTNDTLVPVPDYTLYQDQANELDTLSDRIDGLIKALQVKGGYDASVPELGRILTEGSNTNLIPIKNWAAFSEKNGLAGAIDLIDLTPMAAALKEAYGAFEQIKGQIYEITGIMDIMRGNTEAQETATAQQMKGQYASLRLRDYQTQVAQFATDALRLKAQIMVGKFDPQTLAEIACVDQLSDADKALVYTPTQVPAPTQPQQPGQPPAPPQMVPGPPMTGADGKPIANGPAMRLLFGDRLDDPESDAPNPLRSFRIDIAADSLVQMDEQAEKQGRMDFLTAVGNYLQKALPVVQASPDAGGLVVELLKFGVTGFKVGKQLEGTIDQALDKMLEAAKQPKPPPPPDPKVQAAQIKAQTDAQQAQQAAQLEQQRMQMEGQMERQRLQMEAQVEAQRNQMEAQRGQQQAMLDAAFSRWEALLKARTSIEVAEIGAKSALDTAQISGAEAGVQ